METKKIGNVLLSIDVNHTHEGYVLSVKEYFCFDDISLQHYWGEQFSMRFLILKGRTSKKRNATFFELQKKLIAKINHELTDYNNITDYIVNAFNVIFDKNIKT